MLVIVSEQFCVVRWSGDYYVCRRVGNKKQWMQRCSSYSEADALVRRLRFDG